MNRVPRNVFYGNNETSPAAATPLKFHLAEVAGLVPPYGPRHQVRTSIGYPYNRRPDPPGGHVSLLGPPRRLFNPLTPVDTGSPGAHLLDEFLVNINRDDFA